MSVTQEHDFGCGAACTAFVSGQSYEYAVARLGKYKAGNKGYSCRDIVRLLNRHGKQYEYKYLKPRLKKEIYKENTIVFIARSNRYPAGHYLVRHGSEWMDPWINFYLNDDVSKAESGFRRRLPGRPIYALFSK